MHRITSPGPLHLFQEQLSVGQHYHAAMKIRGLLKFIVGDIEIKLLHSVPEKLLADFFLRFLPGRDILSIFDLEDIAGPPFGVMFRATRSALPALMFTEASGEMPAFSGTGGGSGASRSAYFPLCLTGYSRVSRKEPSLFRARGCTWPG